MLISHIDAGAVEFLTFSLSFSAWHGRLKRITLQSPIGS